MFPKHRGTRRQTWRHAPTSRRSSSSSSSASSTRSRRRRSRSGWPRRTSRSPTCASACPPGRGHRAAAPGHQRGRRARRQGGGREGAGRARGEAAGGQAAGAGARAQSAVDRPSLGRAARHSSHPAVSESRGARYAPSLRPPGQGELRSARAPRLPDQPGRCCAAGARRGALDRPLKRGRVGRTASVPVCPRPFLGRIIGLRT